MKNIKKDLVTIYAFICSYTPVLWYTSHLMNKYNDYSLIPPLESIFLSFLIILSLISTFVILNEYYKYVDKK